MATVVLGWPFSETFGFHYWYDARTDTITLSNGRRCPRPESVSKDALLAQCPQDSSLQLLPRQPQYFNPRASTDLLKDPAFRLTELLPKDTLGLSMTAVQPEHMGISVPKSNPHRRMSFNQQPGSAYEHLDTGFKRRRAEFFRVGRVFKLLWTESGDTSYNKSRWSSPEFASIRWYVVVREGPQSCGAIPIVTYSGRGVSNPGVVKCEHAIVYQGIGAPEPFPDELPIDGEDGMLPQAIRVLSDNVLDELEPRARIDFGRCYTVEHNVKAKNFGLVHHDYEAALLMQWRRVYTGLSLAHNIATSENKLTSTTLSARSEVPKKVKLKSPESDETVKHMQETASRNTDAQNNNARDNNAGDYNLINTDGVDRRRISVTGRFERVQTTYESYILRKATPERKGDRPRWTSAYWDYQPLDPVILADLVEKSNMDVLKENAKLASSQRDVIRDLISERKRSDSDSWAEWVLVYVKPDLVKDLFGHTKETRSIHIILRRQDVRNERLESDERRRSRQLKNINSSPTTAESTLGPDVRVTSRRSDIDSAMGTPTGTLKLVHGNNDSQGSDDGLALRLTSGLHTDEYVIDRNGQAPRHPDRVTLSKDHTTQQQSADQYTVFAQDSFMSDSGAGKCLATIHLSSANVNRMTTATSKPSSHHPPTDEGYFSNEAKQPIDDASNDCDEVDSICTDGRSVALSTTLKERLIARVVEVLRDDMTLVGDARVATLRTIRLQMPILLRQFSIILHAVASTKMQRNSATFVRHYRRPIAHAFCSDAEKAPDPKGIISLSDKMALLWGQDRQIETDMPPDWDTFQLQDIEVEDDAEELELPQVDEARDFLFGGHPYLWLLSNMSRIVRDKDISARSDLVIRNALLEALNAASSASVKSLETHSQHQAEVVLAWAPRKFLAAQFPHSKARLESVITICGDVDDAQASTSGEYVRERWPEVGPRVLKLLSSKGDRLVLDFDEGSRIEAIFEDDRTRLSLSGGLLTLLQALETAVWLGVACRAASFEHEAGYCSPSIKVPTVGKTIDISYSITPLPSADESRSSRADCWLAMFRNPVIAHGYPITARPDGQHGLELNFSMLQALSHTTWLAEFDGVLLLKGFSSLVAPIAQIGSSLLWHLYINKDGTRIPYTAHEGTQLRGLLDQDLLMRARHFVGWQGNVLIVAGTHQASYHSIDLSASNPATPGYAALAGVTITAGKFLTVGGNFVRGQKDTPVYLDSRVRPYSDRVRCAIDWRIALFDTADRIAWLVDGATAILHLCRAWMTWREASFDSKVTADSLWHQDISTPSMAEKVLLNKHNRLLKIFEQDFDETDTEVAPEPTISSKNKKGTSKWWRFEDLVIERWHILESIHDHLVRRRTSPPKDLNLDVWKTTLEGFNFVEVANAKRPIEPRTVRLQDHAGLWPMICKNSDTITLFADGFGTLIAPDEATDCRWNSAPLHSDFMVAPMNVLRRLCSECRHEEDRINSKTAMGSRSSGQLVELTYGIFWKPSDGMFKTCACKCDTNASAKDCSKVVASLREHAAPAEVLSHDLAMAKLLEYSSAALILGDSRSRLRAGMEDRMKIVQDYAKALRPSPRKHTSDSGIDMGTSASSIYSGLSPLSTSNTRSSATSDPQTENGAIDQSISPSPHQSSLTSDAVVQNGHCDQGKARQDTAAFKARLRRSSRIPQLSKAFKGVGTGSKEKQRQEELPSPDVELDSSPPHAPKSRRQSQFASSPRSAA